MRSVLEQLTMIFTGSDCDTKRLLNKQLKEYGLEGEGIIDGRVRFIKSHYPERLGHSKFSVSKVILIVRNPADSFVSLFNMVGTGDHSKSIPDRAFKD